ncbi:MAG: MATE family efflux transporter [Eubacteriales bacterium]|jgi:putative MATE family efflux protein
MAHTNDLGRDSIPKLVLRLAIPTMLAQLVNVLYSIVDRIFIANIPVIGEQALAGAGVCGPVVTLLSSFAFLVGLGGAPLMAIRMGEGRRREAERILSNCTQMLLVLSVTLTILFLLLRQPLLMAFGASPVTYPYANTYMTIYTAGTIFAILATGLNQFITCQGYANLSMFTVLIGAILNIVLDPIFIFALDMGVAGAGVATVLSQAASCLFVLRVLTSDAVRIRIRLRKPNWQIIRRVLLFGLSPFCILATDSLVLIALNSSLQRYGGPEMGDTLVTCATIVLSYMQLISMPMIGITGGTQPILSFNYGAKQVDRIRQGEKYILLMAVTFGTLMFGVSQWIPEVFARIFTSDPTYIDLSVWAIRVYTACVIPMAFQYTFVDGLTALGVPQAAVTLSLMRKITLLVLTMALPLWFGAQSAFYSEPIADLLCGIITTIVFLVVFNRLMRKREAMADDEKLF